MNHRNCILAACLALSACGPPEGEKASSGTSVAPPASGVIVPAPLAAPLRAEVVAQPPGPPAEATPAATTGPLYSCVQGDGSAAQREAIVYTPEVEALCRKAPEMGPCQYERDACRRAGGKVLTAAEVEITPQTEAEYDRRVMRIRMKSN
jgi:hypothetical protein